MNEEKHIIISLGGSLVVPAEVDVVFLESFKNLILSLIKEGYRFTLFVGGGSVCRKYIAAAESVRTLTQEEKDWIGIMVTRANAELVKQIFGEMVHRETIADPHQIPQTDKAIVVGAGWKPGWSTDFDAVVYALETKTKKVINISNIEFVYTKDPRKFSDAEKIEDISWENYRKLIPESWEAGLHSPFDPIASKEAQAGGLEVLILDGKNQDSLKAAILGENFTGTRIHP